jgi:hypothetical protein
MSVLPPSSSMVDTRDGCCPAGPGVVTGATGATGDEYMRGYHGDAYLSPRRRRRSLRTRAEKKGRVVLYETGALMSSVRPSIDRAGSRDFDDSDAAFCRRLTASLARARRLPAEVLAVVFKDEPSGVLSGGHDWDPDGVALRPGSTRRTPQ